MSKQERATRTRTALILSAARLFERYGYVKASLDEISSGAGVSRGALHFHFESKAALADAVEHTAATTLHHTAHNLPHHTNPIQTLIDLSHRMIHLLHHDITVRAGFRLNTDTSPRTPLNLRHQWHTCIHHHVTQAAHQHSLAPHISPDALTNIIVATTTGLETLARTNPTWLTPTPLTHFWQLLLPTITNPPTNPHTNPHPTPTPTPTPPTSTETGTGTETGTPPETKTRPTTNSTPHTHRPGPDTKTKTKTKTGTTDARPHTKNRPKKTASTL
ncbi:ScbR family autoregulator-binding transcription factor [Streptomyces sp. NPDC046465]|uniref:ScbR family autoregulator-binding transcription factor n=1 Tax=Streptomyces sp. NPDC046465 TaxID=3155810 RepID=UPI0033CC6FBA